MSAKRVGIEFLIILVLVLAAAGIWMYKDHTAQLAIEAQREACAAQTAALADSGERWAQAVADGEAHAAFAAFAAGVHPLVLRGGGETLDQAIGALLELPSVSFVHILAPDGAVLSSSDRKLTTTGQVGEDGTWVLTTSGVVERKGATPGARELAAPLVGPSGPAAFLWMGYDIGSAVDEARPADWPGRGDAAAAGDEMNSGGEMTGGDEESGTEASGTGDSAATDGG